MSRKTQIHAETPSGLNLRFFLWFSLFALSNLNGTPVNQFMIVRPFCFDSATYIQKHQVDRPSEI